MKCPNCGGESTGQFCDFCGSEMPKEKDGNTTINIINNYYSEEKTKQYESKPLQENQQPKKKKKTWLWVLGWILIFPLPLTILLIRKKTMKAGLKYGIIAAAWIIYFIIVCSGRGSDNGNTEKANSPANNAAEGQVTDVNDSGNVTDSAIDEFIVGMVDRFNEASSIKLEFVEDFTPSDSSNSHYRVEFRLNAFKDAVGKSYAYGDTKVDIIVYDTLFGDRDSRIYTDNAPYDTVLELVKYMPKYMDSELSDSELQEAVTAVTEKKDADNGMYFGKHSSMIFSGTDNTGYSLMLKKE